MNNLTYTFRENNVRVEMVNNEPWFVAKDVCDVLGLDNVTKAIARLDEDEKGLNSIHTLGGMQNVNTINEPGLYSMILTSRKPEAKDFKRWVTHEVLPSIRKHGMYATPQTIENMLNDPDTMITILQNLKREREEKEAAHKVIEEQQPKVLFADAVTASNDCILVRELANVLKQNGVDIGQNRLFEWMRDNGYMVKYGNLPTQKSMNLELFEVSKVTINVPGKEPKVRTTTKVTGKGQLYFVKKFLKAQNN